VPAPTKGWNTLDSIALMDEHYAVILQNFIPTSSSVALRKGNSLWITGITGRVETLMAYNNGSSSKLFAIVGGSIYDVTNTGALGAPVVTGKSNSRWQYVNYPTSGGYYLYAVNGVDAPLLYDGATWTSITAVSTPAITGVTTTNLINVTVFKNRLWFVENNSLRAWFMPTASIGGAASVLDLSSLFARGGYLMAMGDWTLDSGQGVDDYAVFITSEGEVAVYKGTDPATAATWALVGIYQVGSPIGRRCMAKFASDLIIINQDGLQLMSAALSSSRAYKQPSVTDKIQPSITDAVTAYSANFGWETTIVSKENLLMMNIPVVGGSQQYVMNTLTKGWCNFTGWDAACFEILNDQLYFGTTNGVYKALVGTSDNGVAISGEALQAFSSMGTSSIKYFEMARPIISVDTSNVGILLGLNVDFDISAPVGTPTFTTSTVGTWDSALWDAGVWGGSLAIKKDWQTVGGIGYTGALHMKTQSSTASLQWAATDYTYQTGSGFV
jgi:hypothetical protein